MKITEAVRKYAANSSAGSQKVEGFEPPGGEREGVCVAKGRGPRLQEQPSQFVEKGAEVRSRSQSFTLVPKVSEALWERIGEAKLRFGGGRVSMGTAFEVVVRLKGDRVSPG